MKLFEFEYDYMRYSAILTICATVLIIVLTHLYHQIDTKYIENGYTKIRLPYTSYAEPVWVKEVSTK